MNLRFHAKFSGFLWVSVCVCFELVLVLLLFAVFDVFSCMTRLYIFNHYLISYCIEIDYLCNVYMWAFKFCSFASISLSICLCKYHNISQKWWESIEIKPLKIENITFFYCSYWYLIMMMDDNIKGNIWIRTSAIHFIFYSNRIKLLN